MRPQNQSERQSAIYRFWAIYIVAIMLPMVGFYFLFKNGGGANSEDYKKLTNQIYEYKAAAERTGEIDSLSRKLISLGQSYSGLGKPESEMISIESEINKTKMGLDSIDNNLSENLNRLRFPNTKIYYKSLKGLIFNVKKYHDALFSYAKRNMGKSQENEELVKLKTKNDELTTQIGTLKGELRVLEINCKQK
jgi:hypothetical protein